MSDFLIADGFGNLSDGVHTLGVEREILGEQWPSLIGNFHISDVAADGRKWIRTEFPAISANIGLYNTTTSTASLFVAFRIYPTDRTATPVCVFRDAGSTLGYINVNGAGEIEYVRGQHIFSGGAVIATSSVLPLNAATHVEMEIVWDNVNGEIEIFLNGVSDVAVAGVDTINAGTECDNMRWVPGVTFAIWKGGWKLTDLIVHVGATHLGDAGVYYREEDADGADDDFTPSGGAVDNFTMVDEIGPDEDATYNESDGTSGHRDSFETAGIAGATVLSVQVLTRARKTGGGASSLLLGIEEGGTEEQSAAKALTVDYLTLSEFFDLNPDTLAAWTPAEVTAAENSYEVD